jgi:hypothetical protein
MPAPADRATEPAASALAAAPVSSGRGGPNINPSTGLSTDYLNHFTEAVMVLGLIGTMPECMDDLINWQPKTYTEHFAASRFSNRNAIIAAYHATDPAIRQTLDRNSELLNAMTKRTQELALQHAGTPEVEAIARRALERLRPLISRTAATINGTAAEAVSRQGPQDAIDAMFGS